MSLAMTPPSAQVKTTSLGRADALPHPPSSLTGTGVGRATGVAAAVEVVAEAAGADALGLSSLDNTWSMSAPAAAASKMTATHIAALGTRMVMGRCAPASQARLYAALRTTTGR